MVALKHRHFGALLAICALVLSFFGVTQIVSASVPAHADAPACPAPVMNVSDKVTLDWDNAQLVDHAGHEVHAVGDWWDLGVKLPWQTEGRVKAGDYFTYNANVVNQATGETVLRPNVARSFTVYSHDNVAVGCGTWATDGTVTVIFNDKVESAAQWYGTVTTYGLASYSGPGGETYVVEIGGKATRHLEMTRRTPGEARYQKDGWINLSDSEDGDENKAIMWRVVLPAGDTAVTGASIVDEAPADSSWSFDCDTVNEYTKTHTYLVTDPTTSEGLRRDKDTSNGAFGAAAQIQCTPTKVTVALGEIPANQSAIILLPARVEGAKRASDVVGEFSNTVTYNVPGERVDPITKVLRYGAVADANAHQTFSVTKKVEGDLPEAAKDLDYTLEITLKNTADPTVDKTFKATIKAGETYTYPAPLPPGTEVTVSEGDLPEAAEITWNDAESRVFETADGVTLAADNREASFTLSDDHIFALTLTNTLAPTPSPTPSETPSTPAPTPSMTPSAPAPTPSVTPSPTPNLASTGTDAAGLGVLAGIVAFAGLSFVAAKRRHR
jgi:LPXTG-motif cell wall-anchored protein